MKEKIQKVIINKYLYYGLMVILAMILAIGDLKLKLTNSEIYSNKVLIILGIIGIIVSLTYFIISFIIKRKNFQIYQTFILIAIITGGMYLIASPLFTGSDEHNHYYRIYEITEGNLKTPVQKNNIVGDKLPKSLYDTFTNNEKETINRNSKIKYKDELKMMKKKLNINKKMQYGTEYATEYSNTALYCPLQYLPQVIGFFIGKIFSLGPFWIGEFGRLFNLLFYIGICAYFLKKLPRLQTFAIMILLSPTLISQATTLSADAFTNALIFGFLTLIINNRYNKNKLNNKEKITYIVLSVLLASCKIVYLPFSLLLFLLPNNLFNSKKEKNTFVILTILLASTVGLLWMNQTNIYFDAYYVNTELQKKNILSNIFGYFIVVLRTYMKNFNPLLLNIFAGDNMYHSQLPVYSFLSVLYLVLVTISFFVKEKKKEYETTNLDCKQTIFIIITMLIVLALLTTAIYIQCTANFIAIDNPVIVGLQGRYYLALILCVLLIGGKENINLKIKDNEILVDTSMIVHLFILLQMVVCFVI